MRPWTLWLFYDDALGQPNTWRLVDGVFIARARYAEHPETAICYRLRWRAELSGAQVLQVHPMGDGDGDWFTEPWQAFRLVGPCALRLVGAPPEVAAALKTL